MIGFLRTTSLADSSQLVTAFRQSLKEAGFVEGQNVAIEFRCAVRCAGTQSKPVA